MKRFSLIAVMAFALLCLIGTPAMAGSQGDRIWTAQDTNLKLSSLASGVSPVAVSFPYDPNAQIVAYYIDATAQTAGVSVDCYGATGYVTSGYDFSGATTALHADSAAAASALSAGDLVVVDDGAGNCGWAEVTSVAGAIATLTSSVSDFATSPARSSTTWAAGARIFIMEKVGSLTVGAATKQVDNSQGIFATSKGDPMLLLVDETGSVSAGSATYLNGATVRYE